MVMSSNLSVSTLCYATMWGNDDRGEDKGVNTKQNWTQQYFFKYSYLPNNFACWNEFNSAKLPYR